MSLDGAYEPDNVFAKVIRGELPAFKVFETDEVLAFMDLFPQSRGHALVVSKVARARNLLDVDTGHLTALMLGVQRTARAVQAALRPDGMVVTQFNGAPAGQTVFHLHFHIIPRYADERLRPHSDGAARADAAELAELARRISDEIR